MRHSSKQALIILSVCFIADLVSFILWRWNINDLSLAILAIIFISIIYFGRKDLRSAFIPALIELIVGSQGRLLSADIFNFSLSLRMTIFGAAMIAWLSHVIKQRKTELFQSTFLTRYMALGAFCFLGLVMAIFRHNNWGLIYADFNAWLFFLYAGLFIDAIHEMPDKKLLKPVVLTACAYIGVKTILLFYSFTHLLTINPTLYDWVRDTRWAEVTLVAGNLFRIFSQAQIFLVAGGLLMLPLVVLSKKIDWHLFFIVAMLNAATLICLSRSNWLGVLAGTLIVLIIIIIHRITRSLVWISLWRKLWLVILSFTIFYAILYFPIPNVLGLQADQALKDRLQFNAAAVTSRISQLAPLSKAISQHPIIGSGWGTTITYQTEDPRLLKQTIDGRYTTYAFEWGYLDIILKIGLAGLTAYMFFIWSIAKQLWKSVINSQELKPLTMGGLAVLTGLLITNIFSPYLNHPLGIGIILLIWALTTINETHVTSK